MVKKKFEIDINKYSVSGNVEPVSRGLMPGMKLAVTKNEDIKNV